MNNVYKIYRRELLAFVALAISALTITLLHVLLHPVRVLGMDTSIFYMDEKYTLAAFYSTVIAFLIGFLALTNLQLTKSKAKNLTNLVYGLFFIGLAFDEYFEIHEYANTLIKAAVKDEGIVHSLVNLSWIFPLSIIIVAVFCMFFIKLKQSNPLVRTPIVLGMSCFAVVIAYELLGSASYGKEIYVYFVAIEEGMEMLGASLFLLATLLENKLHKTNGRLP